MDDITLTEVISKVIQQTVTCLYTLVAWNFGQKITL